MTIPTSVRSRCLRTLGHATATAATATAATATVRLHVDHYEDDGVKNYPQSDFPKQMFIEFAETWVGK